MICKIKIGNKMKNKIFFVIVFVTLFFSSNLFAYWRYTTIPGMYGGKDSNGAIICIGTEGVCFTLWEDVQGPSNPADPQPPGYFTGVALFIPSESWGLTGINGVNYLQLGNNIIYSPVKTSLTGEVHSEDEIIDWLNSNNNQQP